MGRPWVLVAPLGATLGYGIANCEMIKLGDFRIENTWESSMSDVAGFLIDRLKLVSVRLPTRPCAGEP